jgi:acyl carrier protein
MHIRQARTDVIPRIIDLVAYQVNTHPQSVRAEMSFAELNADIIDITEIILSVEEEFNVDILEFSDDFNTVQDLIDRVEKELQP